MKINACATEVNFNKLRDDLPRFKTEICPFLRHYFETFFNQNEKTEGGNLWSMTAWPISGDQNFDKNRTYTRINLHTCEVLSIGAFVEEKDSCYYRFTVTEVNRKYLEKLADKIQTLKWGNENIYERSEDRAHLHIWVSAYADALLLL